MLPRPDPGHDCEGVHCPEQRYESSESLIRDIKNYVKRATASRKYPREIEFIAELPKTISIMIKRNELRAADLKKNTDIR